MHLYPLHAAMHRYSACPWRAIRSSTAVHRCALCPSAKEAIPLFRVHERRDYVVLLRLYARQLLNAIRSLRVPLVANDANH